MKEDYTNITMIQKDFFTPTSNTPSTSSAITATRSSMGGTSTTPSTTGSRLRNITLMGKKRECGNIKPTEVLSTVETLQPRNR